MAELTRQGRYDRMTDTFCKLMGEAPTNMRDFLKVRSGAGGITHLGRPFLQTANPDPENLEELLIATSPSRSGATRMTLEM
jgi:hypothetical protein